jgi:hypothetical protein
MTVYVYCRLNCSSNYVRKRRICSLFLVLGWLGLSQGYENYCLLECEAMYSDRHLIFQRNLLPPFLGQKRKQSGEE